MPLLGQGVLAVWNGMVEGEDEEFLEWHAREHIPERIGVPGFLRGRRYAAVEGEPAFFNFYEVEAPGVLTSTPYLRRLNDPTPWTGAVVAGFTDTLRTMCRVTESIGTGTGCHLDVIRFDTWSALATQAARVAVSEAASRRGIFGAHLIVRDDGQVPAETAETRLRGAPDRSVAAVIMIEAADEEAIRRLRGEGFADHDLGRAGLPMPAARGLYRFQFGLDEFELAAGKGQRAEITSMTGS